MGDPELKSWTQDGNAFFVAFDEEKHDVIIGIASVKLSKNSKEVDISEN